MTTATIHPIPTTHPAGHQSDAELLCSVCGQPVRHAPPDYYLAADPDRVPRYSHHDGSGLCVRPDGGGPAAPRPREIRRILAGRSMRGAA